MTRRSGAALAAQIERLDVPEGMLALWALGQSGMVIKGGQTVAVIDPYLSDAVRGMGGPARRFPPPIAPHELSRVDLVLCTHEHPDHTDAETLVPLLAAAPDARLVVSVQSGATLREAGISAERLHVPTLGRAEAVKGLRYTALPAAHPEVEIDAEGHARWMAFLVECNGVRLFHAGDTVVAPELLQALQPNARRPLDLALLPINGRDTFRERSGLVGNLLPREATELAAEIGAEVLIPLHNDLFDENRLNPAELWDDLDRRFPQQRCHPLQPGELYLYVGGAAWREE